MPSCRLCRDLPAGARLCRTCRRRLLKVARDARPASADQAGHAWRVALYRGRVARCLPLFVGGA